MSLVRYHLLLFLYLNTFSTLVNGFSQEKQELRWQYDNNKEESKCKISLWARPLEGSKTEDIAMMHWVLVFEWEDQISSYEANEVDGYVKPTWFSGKPKAHQKAWQGKKTQDWGIYILSPKQVNRAAFNNRHNGLKYDLGYVNCQNWVEALAKELEIDIPQETIEQKNPLAAFFASVFCVIILIYNALLR